MKHICSLVLFCLAVLGTPSQATAGGTHLPHKSLERVWLSASELKVVCGAVPRAFRAFRTLLTDQKELLQGSFRAVPLADVRSTLEEHADYLGLNIRNTKYISPKVSGVTILMLCFS